MSSIEPITIFFLNKIDKVKEIVAPHQIKKIKGK